VGLGLPSIGPVPGARAFLHHAVNAAALVLRGTIMIGNEGFVSTAALNQPSAISVTQIPERGHGAG
jgi:hypothetical protein